MSVARRWAGDGVRAVSVICHSPARRAAYSGAAGGLEDIFLWKRNTGLKKDFLSLWPCIQAMICHLPHRSENQNIRRLPFRRATAQFGGMNVGASV